MAAMQRVAGVDFTSRPSRRKPVTVALGRCEGRFVTLERIEAHADYASLGAWLRTPGPWLGAFDFPFGLPRALIAHLGWPEDWLGAMRHYATLSRPEIRATFAAFCDARPAGSKFAHRGCDATAGSSSSMKWVNPPVAYMMHAGVALLLEAGVELPGMHPGDPQRIALEGYPGLLARELIGRRSYKSDTRVMQTAARRAARADLVAALVAGRSRLGLSLALTPPQHAELVDDGGADRLDAVLCLVQAAWAAAQPNHGRPPGFDPLEGWIVSAPAGADFSPRGTPTP